MPAIRRQRLASAREAVCTHCGRGCEVGPRAMSVACPHCNKRLILEDFTISTYYAVREFATCGDIEVEKQGQVCALIKVGNLTVKGKVWGDVSARGRVAVHHTGTLKGDVRAPTLHVESGARLEGFLRIGAALDGDVGGVAGAGAIHRR